MEQYYLSSVSTYKAFFEKYKQIEGYLHSLTHNVLVGKIDGFVEVLQMIIDGMSKECQVSDGDKMEVKVATQLKQLSIIARNNKKFYDVATISYCKVTEVFNVKEERLFWEKSEGATAEHAVARKAGIKITYL